LRGPTSKGGEGREKGEEGWRMERRGGLSDNVAEEAFCLKSAPDSSCSIQPMLQLVGNKPRRPSQHDVTNSQHETQ